jgi:hypothetical protein
MRRQVFGLGALELIGAALLMGFALAFMGKAAPGRWVWAWRWR